MTGKIREKDFGDESGDETFCLARYLFCRLWPSVRLLPDDMYLPTLGP